MMNLRDWRKLILPEVRRFYGQTPIIYGMLAIQSVPYLIWYSLTFERRVFIILAHCGSEWVKTS